MIRASVKQKSQPSRSAPGDDERRVPNRFWRKASHADMDRAGDFILKNLELIRQEATIRGDSR
jgi:hypothetical protein